MGVYVGEDKHAIVQMVDWGRLPDMNKVMMGAGVMSVCLFVMSQCYSNMHGGDHTEATLT